MLLLGLLLLAEPPPPAPEPKPQDSSQRVELNLLGKADTDAGESRRNENIQFNLVDNNLLKELNIRLGTTATLVKEFVPERGYFGAEFGNAPSGPIHVPFLKKIDFTGTLRYFHQNSIFSGRSFFQVGDVKPAHDNDYGFTGNVRLWRGAWLGLEGGQQFIRGQVNGNVLVPKPDERTPLATDPETRAMVEKFLNAYPTELPNRTDINPRALNTNSPQSINNNQGGIRLDQLLGTRDRFTTQYNYTSQHVDAFELVAGQNPDTDTRSHRARATWARTWSAATTVELSAGFDRIGSLLVPEPNAVGPMVSPSGLETLGPQAIIPIDRAQNLYRYAGQLRSTHGSHTWTMGFGLLRRQLNGTETDAHRGYFGFANDFGRDGITNLRLGTPSQYIVSIGDVHRGFRNWEGQLFAGDVWRVSPAITVNYGLRWAPVTQPYEVNNLNTIPYGSDWNNVAPMAGVAARLPGRWGVLRTGFGVQYGDIFPVTFQQVRFSPPLSVKIVVPAPSLVDPLNGVNASEAKGNLYLLDPKLATPYEYQYNAAWEFALTDSWRIQLGYVGSRAHKLLVMWYTNRAQPVPGIPQTTATLNQRRPDPRYADVRFVLNGSRGYFDAARAALAVPRWHGLSMDVAYWFSKAMDLGSSYTNTAYDADSRLGRSQWEYETHSDMKGRSTFDQPHSFLARGSYEWRNWRISAIGLMKQGTPFTVGSGSDAPGYGNVDGNGNDRPNLLDPSILGRTIGNPDTSRFLLPRSAFGYIAPTDPRGNLGRNTFRKGSIRNVNLAMSYRWRWFTWRVESINLLNTPQFADPGTDLSNPNFGQITNTLNDGRAFRFGILLAR